MASDSGRRYHDGNMLRFSGLKGKTTHAVHFTVQKSSAQVYFKLELQSFWHRNTPPFILGYKLTIHLNFKTNLYTAHNKSTCCAFAHVSNTGATSCVVVQRTSHTN